MKGSVHFHKATEPCTPRCSEQVTPEMATFLDNAERRLEVLIETGTCAAHPRYKVEQPPRPSEKYPDGCPDCHFLWEAKHGK